MTHRRSETIVRGHPLDRTGIEPATYRAKMDGILAARRFPGADRARRLPGRGRRRFGAEFPATARGLP